MADRRRRVLRFFGPRGDLLVAEAPSIAVFDATGYERFRVEVEGFLDVAPVGDELWVISASQLARLAASDEPMLGSERLDYLDSNGRILQSATAPHVPVWHAARPSAIRSATPPIAAELILPIADGRWLLWQNGQLRLWRNIGEAWRKPLGDPGTRAADAQLVLDGRLFVLAQQRASAPGDPPGELRLSIAAVTDGAPHAVLRIPQVERLAIAARRGLAVARSGDRLSVFDLRFGRWLRDLVVPAGTIELAVDDVFQRIALATETGLELVSPDALAAAIVASDDDGDAKPERRRDPTARARARAAAVAVARAVAGSRRGQRAGRRGRIRPAVPERAARAARAGASHARRDARRGRAVGRAGAAAGRRARVRGDRGRVGLRCIVKADQTKPPFVDEVAGLLKIVSGRAVNELERATARLDATRVIADDARRERGERLTPLDVLARDFGLSPLAVDMFS